MFPKESQTIEFKRLWKDDFFRELCAFANCQGGTLYIGVEDDGTVCGVRNAGYLLENLPNKIRNTLGFVADVNLHLEENQEYITVYVHPQETAVSFESKYFVRSGSTTQELRGQELLMFLTSKSKTRWDALPNQCATIGDLDAEKIRSFVGLARERRCFAVKFDEDHIPAVLRALRLLTAQGQITNAALLLFAKDPQQWFITSVVKCAQFYSTVVEKPIKSQHIYEGNVFELIDQAVSFVASRIDARVGERTKSAQVDVDYELPLQAVTEAIVNAVVHRDYTSNASVQVMLFRDRLEVWNPGRLPHGMTIDELTSEHQSMPVNPTLAYPVYLAGYIEQLGTGTNDLVQLCTQKGLQSPDFRQSEYFVTTLWRPKTGQVIGQVTGQVSGQVTGHETDHQTGHQIKSVSLQVQKLVKAVRGDTKTREEIMEILHLKGRDNFRSSYLTPAIKDGLLSSLYPDTPNHNAQAYYLTDKGLDLLETLQEK